MAEERRSLSDDEITTTHPGETRSRWSVTDADGGDDDQDGDDSDGSDDTDGDDAS